MYSNRFFRTQIVNSSMFSGSGWLSWIVVSLQLLLEFDWGFKVKAISWVLQAVPSPQVQINGRKPSFSSLLPSELLSPTFLLPQDQKMKISVTTHELPKHKYPHLNEKHIKLFQSHLSQNTNTRQLLVNISLFRILQWNACYIIENSSMLENYQSILKKKKKLPKHIFKKLPETKHMHSL